MTILLLSGPFSVKFSSLRSKLACGRHNSSLDTSLRSLTIVDIFYGFDVYFLIQNDYSTESAYKWTYLGKKRINFS